MASEQEKAEIQNEIAGEVDAIHGDVQKMIQEAVTAAVAAKEAENLDLKNQITQARKDGAAIAVATIKRRLGIL